MEKYNGISQSAIDIMNEIDSAIAKFGTYSFDDKGPWDVINVTLIRNTLFSTKSIKEIGNILSEVIDNHSDYNRALRTVNCIIAEFDNLTDDQFDELLSLDDRFEY